MAVQTFGNRILGGIGATGASMSEAFGAGANTALGQREALQAMRLRDIDLQWKTEDREEAKRRSAAAAAAAAAAKKANMEALARLGGQPFFQLGAATPPAAPPTAAPAQTRFRPAPPMAPGVQLPSTYSMGTPGVAVPLPTQTRFRSAPAPAPMSVPATPGVAVPPPAPTFYAPGTGDLSARPGDFAARATAERVQNLPLIERGGYQGVGGPRADLEAAVAGLDAARAAFAADPSGENLDQVRWWQQTVERLQPAVEQFDYVKRQDYTSRTPLALEGPESLGAVTIQGPNGPVTVPTEEAMRFPPAGVRPPAPEAGQASFDLGLMGAQPLTFGEQLGAVQSPTTVFFEQLASAPAGALDLPALVAQQNSPVFDPNFSAAAEQERAVYAYLAEVAMAKGDIDEYLTASSKVREMETLILTQQLEIGLNEAVNFGSAQRLSAVASMVYGGAEVVVIPKGAGRGDVYMDGRLAQPDADLVAMGSELRSTVDAAYRAQVAAAAAEREQKVFDARLGADKEIAVAEAKAQLEAEQAATDMVNALEQDLGIRINDLQAQKLKAALVASGMLSAPDRKLSLIQTDDGGFVVFDETTGEIGLQYVWTENEDGTTSLSEVRR